MNDIHPALRKVAILVSSLDRATADKLLDQMSDEQAALVRRVMVDLPEIDAGEQNRVIDEFFHVGPREEADDAAAVTLVGRPVGTSRAQRRLRARTTRTRSGR